MHRILVPAIVTLLATSAFAQQAPQSWAIVGGETAFSVSPELSNVGVFLSDGQSTYPVPQHVTFSVRGDSSLEVVADRGILEGFSTGQALHDKGVVITSAAGEVWFGEFALESSKIGLDGTLQIRPDGKHDETVVLELADVKIGFDRLLRRLLIEAGEARITPGLARALGDDTLMGQSVGSVTMLAWVEPTGVHTPDSIEDDADGGVAGGNNGTNCWNPGDPLIGPDVIVGELYDLASYAKVGSIDAFAVGTISCNIGSQNLSWVSNTNQHPVIGGNMYRLRNGRFEQIGQSWLKHGFTALTNNDCGCGCSGVGGSQLGIGCSDPYSAGLNGSQSGLGPKFEVNPNTGVFAYPYTGQGQSGNSIYKRIQVAVSDVDTALNPGALYFVEGQYVAPDDAASGNQNNSVSYRRVSFSDGNSDGDWDIAFVAGQGTQREQAAIRAWKDNDATVTETDVQVASDGLIIVSSQATALGGGMYHYEYAVQNVNHERSVGAFTVPFPAGTSIQNVGFHDVNYHSGEPYDGTDWSSSVGSTSITWSTTPYATDPNANALRWGTMYNFRFDANLAPITLDVTLGLFKPGSPAAVNAAAVVPSGTPPVCGNNSVDAGEECDPPDGLHCSALCQWVCGDAVTQSGEECDDGNAVNNDGCTNACTLPECGDGIQQAGEECDDGNTSNTDGCTNACTLPECGDGFVQAGEQCDDGNTVSGDGCSATCVSESNDLCAGSAPVTNGSYAFSTVNTVTDGPAVSCGSGNAYNDIWYNYTATCTGTLTVSTCNTANYDSLVVVYDGCACSGFSALACVDDTTNCGTTTILDASVVQGSCYKVRLGGFSGSSEGTGTVSFSCAGPSCGNSVVEAGEDCDPPNGTTCDSNCQRIPICGDSIVDAGEGCDDGNTTSGDGCSATCQVETGGPANNDCVNATAITGGTTTFNTTNATTDGPAETLGNCGKFGYTQVGADIWYCYTASCNGTVTVSLCGSSYDTKVAVYNGCVCPTGPSSMACNDDSCSFQSQTTFASVNGNNYLIRVGGYNANTGAGTMSVTCAPSGCQSNSECNDSNLCTTDTCNGGTCVNANNTLPCDDGDGCTLNDACSGGACVGGAGPTCPPGASYCTDCNNNNVRDDCDNLADCDANGYPDVCEYTDCNNNSVADVCDIFNGLEDDCDGGPVGSKVNGQVLFNSLCVFCHGAGGAGGVAPNIQNKTRVQIWDKLLPPTNHAGGAHPEYSQQDFANLEAYLAQAGSGGRPDRLPDSCQSLADCNGNGTSDGCELGAGSQTDADYDGVPDTCVCSTNAECDDGKFCSGAETCVAGACVAGSDPCPGQNCNETTNSCGDCAINSDCDDGDYCNGAETCVSGSCVAGTDPCGEDICDEGTDSCVSCLTNAHCDDGVFCNGAETCVSGSCAAGANPCTTGTCFEPAGRCIPSSCPAPAAVGEGSRYIEVIPAAGTGPVALIVTGDVSDADVSCITAYVQADGKLGFTPIFQTPEQWGTVHVHDSEIIPSTVFSVRSDCGAVGLSVVSGPVDATTWRWGDPSGDGNVNLDDLLCILAGFGGQFEIMPAFCSREACDLMGCTPNYIINLDDILADIGAFGGQGMNCPSPCP